MLLCRTSKLDLVTSSTAFSLLDNYNPQYSRMAVSASGIYNRFRNLFLLQWRNMKLGASNVIFGGAENYVEVKEYSPSCQVCTSRKERRVGGACAALSVHFYRRSGYS